MGFTYAIGMRAPDGRAIHGRLYLSYFNPANRFVATVFWSEDHFNEIGATAAEAEQAALAVLQDDHGFELIDQSRSSERMHVRIATNPGGSALEKGELAISLTEDELDEIAGLSNGSELAGWLHREFRPVLQESQRRILDGWMRDDNASWGYVLVDAGRVKDGGADYDPSQRSAEIDRVIARLGGMDNEE